MATASIAVLFDAENINCETASRVLKKLTNLGTVPIRRAVGNFSAASLANWIDCGRDNGIELVLQPGLGKGKNGADIRLTIEAMDIAHQGRVDTVALVTHDRDFAPLALRLRNAHLTVLGFAQTEPHAAFREACSAFVVIGKPVPMIAKQPVAKQPPVAAAPPGEVERLRELARQVSADGPVAFAALNSVIKAAVPAFAEHLSGDGSLKRIVKLGVIERVGKAEGQLVRALPGHRAS